MPRRKLTAQTIEKLRPPDHGRVEYFDTLIPGFGLRVTSNGVKSWILFYRINGRQRRMTMGRYPVFTLAEARENARQALQRVALGIDPAEERKQPQLADTMIVGAIADEFIFKYAKPNTKAWRETARIIDKDIRPSWSDRSIDAITRADIRVLVDSVVARGSPVAANHVFGIIRHLLNWSVECGYITASPAAGMRAPTKVRSRERALTDDELVAVWHACEEIGHPFGTLGQLLIATGQRRGEVASLRWEELDMANRTWTIPAERNKSGRTHSVPLSDLAISVLEKVPVLNSSPYLFTTRGDVPVSGFSKSKLLINQHAGFSDWRIHDLRRTVASGLAKLGTPESVISKILNHASGGGVTAIYNRHGYDDEKRDALAHWGQRVGELAIDVKRQSVG